jgi:hypothetical protein
MPERLHPERCELSDLAGLTLGRSIDDEKIHGRAPQGCDPSCLLLAWLRLTQVKLIRNKNSSKVDLAQRRLIGDR